MKRFPYLIMVLLLGSCLFETETTLPTHRPLVYYEDFQYESEEKFLQSSWQTHATIGNVKWNYKTFSNNGYVEFSAFNSGEETNEAWLYSPEIELPPQKELSLTFKVAHHHLKDTLANKIQLFVIENTLGEEQLKEISFQKPVPSEQNYQWKTSGYISLKPFSGKIKIAFKATGGRAVEKSGAYMIDEIKIF